MPVAVPPSKAQLAEGAAEVPQHVPRSVIAAPPLDVMFAPRVAVVLPIDVAVGEERAGTPAADVDWLAAAGVGL